MQIQHFLMNSFTLILENMKIRNCPSYFSGFFISSEWHPCIKNHLDSNYMRTIFSRKYENIRYMY